MLGLTSCCSQEASPTSRRKQGRVPEEKLRHLFEDYCEAIVLITGKSAVGDVVSGTGFHIGNGVIATARHVAEVQELGIHYKSNVLQTGRTLYHRDERVDLAVIETSFADHWFEKISYHGDERRTTGRSSFVPMGGHLDDWIGDEFILSRVLLMGYPHVPLTRETVLLAVQGEINGIVDKYVTPHPYFIISSVPRGGFSGGPVLSEWGFLLGVMTESLTTDSAESGFAAVLTIEPLLTLLAENGIRPPEFDDELWQTLTGPPPEA